MERNAVALFCERTGERAAVLAQNGEIVRACAVRQSKGRGEPPHRDPGGDSEIMPFGKLESARSYCRKFSAAPSKHWR